MLHFCVFLLYTIFTWWGEVMATTTTSFIERLKDKFGDSLDYSKTVFVNWRTKVTIICHVHGERTVNPKSFVKQKHHCVQCFQESRRTDPEEFIRKANEIHKNRYDYSKVDYKGSFEKITIICPIHGEFKKAPYSHLNGIGCKQCGIARRTESMKYTTEIFIDKAKNIHGEQYDYSLVDYVCSSGKVKISCPEHGVFEQTPNSHLSGQGCPLCGNKKAGTSNTWGLDKFIEKSIEVHGETYDYGESVYQGANTPIKIICKKHGEFHQTPTAHVTLKQGCRICGNERASINRTKSTEEFIEEATKVHGDLFSYELVDYKNSSEKVKIICSKHGMFEQLPSSHLYGYGCVRCGAEKRAEPNKITQEEFMRRVRETHGYRYDYTKSVYDGAANKIEIICSEHGSFWQGAADHARGVGCPLCAHQNHVGSYNTENIQNYVGVEGLIYHVSISKDDQKFEKIGITKRSIHDRFYKDTLNGYQITILDQIHGDIPYVFELEKKVLAYLDQTKQRYTQSSLRGDFAGWTECFEPEFFNLSDFYQDLLDY